MQQPFLCALVVLVAAACSDPKNSSDAAVPSDTGPSDTGLSDSGPSDSLADTAPDKDAADFGPDAGDLTHLQEIEGAPEFEILEGQIGQAAILGIRFWLRVDGKSAPAPLDGTCIFQNTKRFPYHYPFLSHFPELAHITFDDYTKMIMGPERVWWAGIVRRHATALHPRYKKPGVVIYQLWQDADESLSVSQLVQVDRRLKSCISYASKLLVLVPEEPQAAHFKDLQADLDEEAVDLLFPSSLPEAP